MKCKQSTCLVIHPCIRLNDGPNIKLVELFKLVGVGLSLVYGLAIWGSTGGFLLLRYFNHGFVSHPTGLRVSQYIVSVESSLALFVKNLHTDQMF